MFTGKGINGVAKRFIRAGYGSKTRNFNRTFNTTSYLINFEIQKYYQNKPRFNGVCSRDNLPDKLRDGGTYVINLDDYSDIGTHGLCCMH